MEEQVLVVGWDGATDFHLAEYDLEWYDGLDHGGRLLPRLRQYCKEGIIKMLSKMAGDRHGVTTQVSVLSSKNTSSVVIGDQPLVEAGVDGAASPLPDEPRNLAALLDSEVLATKDILEDIDKRDDVLAGVQNRLPLIPVVEARCLLD